MPTVAEAPMLEALRRERNRFVAFAFAASDLVLEVGRDGAITYAAGAGKEILGIDTDRLLGVDFFGLFAADDSASLRSAFGATAVGARSGALRARVIGQDGKMRRVRVRAYRLPEAGAGTFVSVSHALPVEEPRGASSASRDPALGLLESEGFAQSVSRRMAEAQSNDRKLSLTLLEMAGLSGEGADASPGDQRVMSEVAGLLRARAAEADDVGHLGTGKLGIVHDAEAPFDSLASEIEEITKRLHDGARKIAVQSKAVDLDSEMSEADTTRAILFTLNKFTEAGPDALAFDSLSAGCRVMFAETLEWSSRIKRTIAERRFALAFQPIVRLSDRQVHHYEALFRLPDSQDITPFKFITMAEQLGSIAELDLAIVEQAIHTLRSECRAGESIAVNVSGRSLVAPGFVEALTGRIERNADLTGRMLLEVTESAKIVDLEGVNRALQALRALSIRVCLDDFGAGAAAFEYLRSLNVDILKIDGSFVRNVSASMFNSAFLRSIASLCEGLGIITIAEMIEDETTANAVRAAGVVLGQGYHFGRPAALAGPAGAASPSGKAKLKYAGGQWVGG
ncbi:MAG: EAL domain-containing protein [Alphaproteobacteria bacterium]